MVRCLELIDHQDVNLLSVCRSVKKGLGTESQTAATQHQGTNKRILLYSSIHPFINLSPVYDYPSIN